jgi:L-asparaginase II
MAMSGALPSRPNSTIVNPVLVEVVRGPLIESRHRASVMCVDIKDREVLSYGDVDQVVLPRSSLKPFQALTMVESGAMDAFGLGDVELALHCGSHNGEPDHVEKVTAWLGKIGCEESHLECPPDRPLGEKWLHLHPRDCASASRLANNCSGKHAGFLTTVRHMGEPLKGYLDSTRKIQRYVAEILGDLSGTSISNMPVACDNCGAPVFGLPLRALARASAALVNPDRFPAGRADSIRRVFAAMRAHPMLVAGTGRTDTILMQDGAFNGISKVGAEGVFIAAVPGFNIGLAIKVDDGGDRAASALAIAVLNQLDVLDRPSAARIFNQVTRPVAHPGANPGANPISHIRIPGFTLHDSSSEH